MAASGMEVHCNDVTGISNTCSDDHRGEQLNRSARERLWIPRSSVPIPLRAVQPLQP
jgi:hypothetical protein